jgi:hypothetical protein
VADIFISYSKQDQEQARLLAAVLEAEGYSVWWDASLLSGDNYRKVIMTELGRARATIVIWTENSIHSDWVQSEAGRAHADRRLIPVKAKGLSYKDIPPPFDNMHIENLDDREKILAAVVALLAKPEVAPSPLRRMSKRARLELLSWVGIAGAVITVTTNLQSLLTLSKWLRQLLESWIAVITFVWGRVFFFLPKMYAPDAVQLTFLLFVIVNLAMCSRARQGSEPNTSRMTAALRLVSVGTAAVLISLVFILGTIVAGVPADQDGYSVVLVDRSWFIVKYLQGMNAPVPVVMLLFVVFLLVVFLLPLLPVIIAYWLLRVFFSFRLDTAALASRLWRILLGVGAVLALNHLSPWIEQQLLAAGLLK